jgi:hypothetical protein
VYPASPIIKENREAGSEKRSVELRRIDKAFLQKYRLKVLF